MTTALTWFQVKVHLGNLLCPALIALVAGVIIYNEVQRYRDRRRKQK